MKQKQLNIQCPGQPDESQAGWKRAAVKIKVPRRSVLARVSGWDCFGRERLFIAPPSRANAWFQNPA
jgi:hypothetical protein